MDDINRASQNAVFEEVQGFRQTWLMLLLLFIVAISVGFVVYSSYMQLYKGIPVGNKPMGDTGLIVSNIFILLVGIGLPLGIMFMKLRVVIEQDALYLRYFPIAKKTYRTDEIAKCEALTYSPIADYGGWGVRYSLTKKHWAYNVSGNRGVMIDFKNGRKVLIGSQKADEFAQALSAVIGRG